MKKYLFLFTIGPVQSFIVQTRKTQDLYTGSLLLSDLIDFAMKDIKGVDEFIFPDKNAKSKPNRFILIIKSDDVSKIGEDLSNYVQSKFKGMALKSFNSLDEKYSEGFMNNFLKQIKNHLQVNWVALRLLGDKSDYAQVYKDIEFNLGAIKNVRNFRQLKERGRKCSVCGERNVLFYKLTDKERENGGLAKRKNDNLLEKLYTEKEKVMFLESDKQGGELRMQKGEGLCAVCSTKRFYKSNSFRSVTWIAAMDWINSISEDKQDAYKNLFTNFDEQLYYAENLHNKYLEEHGHFKKKKCLKDTSVQLKEFYKIKVKDEHGEEVEIGKPSKYYAIIMFDSDNMGKWLSGDLPEGEVKG